MFCRNCGNALPDGAKLCPECGWAFPPPPVLGSSSRKPAHGPMHGWDWAWFFGGLLSGLASPAAGFAGYLINHQFNFYLAGGAYLVLLVKVFVGLQRNTPFNRGLTWGLGLVPILAGMAVLGAFGYCLYYVFTHK